MTPHAHTPGPSKQVPDLVQLELVAMRCQELEKLIPQLVEALKVCQVRIFMVDGSENEPYRQAQAALRAVEEGRP